MCICQVRGVPYQLVTQEKCEAARSNDHETAVKIMQDKSATFCKPLDNFTATDSN